MLEGDEIKIKIRSKIKRGTQKSEMPPGGILFFLLFLGFWGFLFLCVNGLRSRSGIAAPVIFSPGRCPGG
jgi:hypothetical protein